MKVIRTEQSIIVADSISSIEIEFFAGVSSEANRKVAINHGSGKYATPFLSEEKAASLLTLIYIWLTCGEAAGSDDWNENRDGTFESFRLDMELRKS